MNIREYIPKGREHTVSRPALIRITGKDDRSVRDLISRSNMDNSAPPICNIGYGYFIATPDDRDAVREYRNKEVSRIRKMRKKIDCINKWLEDTDSDQFWMDL